MHIITKRYIHTVIMHHTAPSLHMHQKLAQNQVIKLPCQIIMYML